MDKKELLLKLKFLLEECEGDEEENHIQADNLLLKYINDPEIEKAFRVIPKWYA